MKYILIKQLPFENSPKIGYISLPIGEANNKDHYWNGLWFNPENYPEFWQEVLDKDYEILYVVIPEGLGVVCNGTYNKIPAEKYKIHSIKRLSDSVVFTIGDNLNFNNKGTGKLLRLDYEKAPIDKGTGKLCFINDNKLLGDWWSINEIEHAKKVLCVTEDGVDIFEGNNFWEVLDNFKLYEVFFENIKYFLEGNNRKAFSTKNAAENWIILNKPCLSINSIATMMHNHRGNHSFNNSVISNLLKELVKSKL